MRREELLDSLYLADLGARIEIARRLYELHGRQLRDHVVGAERIGELDRLALEVESRMREAGIERICADCGREFDGACCTEHISQQVDALQLLLNLLLGGQVETFDPGPDACRFLGPDGCSVQLKPMICIDHLCPEIRQLLPADDLERVTRATADLLNAQVEAEDLLLVWLKGSDDPPR